MAKLSIRGESNRWVFGEERYFADSSAFWDKQGAAIAERKLAYHDAGWLEVEILDVGQHFAAWNHRKVTRTKGGKVFIAIARNGEVTFHEGYLTQKEADRAKKKAKKVEALPDEVKPDRPELTSAMRNYLGLHRHAAVRTELLGHPDLMLRLAVAHIIAGSSLWRVEAEPQRADRKEIAESLSQSKADQAFAVDRACVRGLLGLEQDEDGRTANAPFVGNRQANDLKAALQMLIAMDDETVLRILAFVMAETLAAHSPVVDMLGQQIGIDMRDWWTPDEAFFGLSRDKAAINAMLAEVAGEVTASAHVASTAKVQKKIIADCLSGEGRTKVEGWLPRYMQFPAGGYTSRFGEEAARTVSLADADEAGEIDFIEEDAFADAA